MYQVYTKQTVKDKQKQKQVNELPLADDFMETKNHVDNISDNGNVESASGDIMSSALDIHSTMLRDYLRLSVNLQSLYEDWSKRGNWAKSFISVTVLVGLGDYNFVPF